MRKTGCKIAVFLISLSVYNTARCERTRFARRCIRFVNDTHNWQLLPLRLAFNAICIAISIFHISSSRRCVVILPTSRRERFFTAAQLSVGRYPVHTSLFVYFFQLSALAYVKQEAQLSPSDREMRLVSSNLANCHATVQKVLMRQVLTKLMV